MTSSTVKCAKYLSRQRHRVYDSLLRVDHSGELGADRIYMGQMFALRNDKKHAPVIQHMWDQEKKHLEQFEKNILKYRTRKSMLTPLWSMAGFVLGASTASMGYKAAMACTVAVETVITEHYNNQIRDLISDDPQEHQQLIQTLSEFRDEEQEHHDIGIEHDAQQANAYKLLTNVIENGCRLAVKVAQKI